MTHRIEWQPNARAGRVLWCDPPDPAWEAGPRVRVDSLAVGQRFLAVDGRRYQYERRDGALSGVYHVVGDNGHNTCFAGCAEVVVLP